MTVTSAWWRSNMPFQRLSGRLNYYITWWRQEVSELEIRWLSSPGEREDTTLMAIRVGVNILHFCSVSNSLSHTQPFQIKWGVYFLKEVFARLYYFVNINMCIYAYLLYEYTTTLVLFELFLVAVISHSLFSCSHQLTLSLYRRCLQCWWVLFFLFLAHIVCLSHFWSVRSLVFLPYGQFVEVLSSSTLRMVPSILKGGLLRYLSFSWGFCSIVWYWVVF